MNTTKSDGAAQYRRTQRGVGRIIRQATGDDKGVRGSIGGSSESQLVEKAWKEGVKR